MTRRAIEQFNKNMKLLLIVRDPVERMVSHLLHTHNLLSSGQSPTWEVLMKKVTTNDKMTGNLTVKRSSLALDYSNYYQLV